MGTKDLSLNRVGKSSCDRIVRIRLIVLKLNIYICTLNLDHLPEDANTVLPVVGKPECIYFASWK